jgi:cell division protein FtsZ
MTEINLVEESKKDMLTFDSPKGLASIIKVIGVGGGGNNAVNHMYKLGIIGVDFINCNTDLQVLEASPVPNTIRFGDLGTGAGSNPEKGRELAEQSDDEIRSFLKGTQMVFITAGMGGGTGTGAAPVIAAIAREMNILTVAIVTEPFAIEGKRRMEQARQGIRKLKNYVDVLLVINNDRLREQYGDLVLSEAFQKADDVLANAVKGIAEIITVRGYMNVDLEDVKTVMRNSGTAIMGMGLAEGEDRAANAVDEALNSPLLNNINIRGSKNLLIYITYGNAEVKMDEMGEITELVHDRTGNNADLILGYGQDERLGNHIAVSIIATGFDMPGYKEDENDKVKDQIPNPIPNPPVPPVQPAQPESVEKKKVIPLDGEVIEDTPDQIEEVSVVQPIVSTSENEIANATENLIDGIHIVNKGDNAPEIESKEKEDVKEEIFSFHQDHKAPFRQPVVQSDMSATSEERPHKVIVVEDDDLEFHVSEQPNFINNYHSGASPVMVRVQPETTAYPKQKSDQNDNLSKSRAEKFRRFSIFSKPNEISETVMEEPAYLRRNVQFEPADHSSESYASNYHLFPGEDGLIMQPNPYLHDNVD